MQKGEITLFRKEHDRWYITANDEINDTWLTGDRNDRPQESWGMPLWKIGQSLAEAILTIRTSDVDTKIKMSTANRLREILQECIWDENLSELTSIYRYEEEDNILGYSTTAVSAFVGRLVDEYSKP